MDRKINSLSNRFNEDLKQIERTAKMNDSVAKYSGIFAMGKSSESRLGDSDNESRYHDDLI